MTEAELDELRTLRDILIETSNSQFTLTTSGYDAEVRLINVMMKRTWQRKIDALDEAIHALEQL
jgi:hypothetical protein